MPQLTVWHDPHSDELFRTKDEYVKHLKDLAWHRYHERMADKTADELGYIINKRKDHVKTCGDLAEFIDEYIHLAHEHVAWVSYRNPKKYILDYKGVQVDWIRTTIVGAYAHLVLSIKIDYKISHDCSGIAGYYTKLLTTLGLYVHNFVTIFTGKWDLLNQYVMINYNEQVSAYNIELERQQIIARLKGEPCKPPKFEYRGLYNAKGDGLPV